MTNTPNSKQKFINICSGWSEVDYWGTENSGKRASFNNWPSGDDNEQTSSSDSGLWTTNSSCSSVDFSFLKEDLSLMKKEVLLTHEEALLINEFCEKMVSVGKKNEQEYKNEFCRGIKSEQEYKGKSNQEKNWTEGALGNIKNLVDEYLGRGIKLDSYCNDNKETVVDLIFQEIIGILESTTNITSGSEALGFGSLGYDEDEAIKIENITIIQSVVCQLLLRGGRVKRHLFYHDRIAHATTSFMGNDPYKHLDQYISNEYEEIKEQLKNIVCVSIVNKGNQAQEYVLAVEIDNEHFYVKCAQDSIIEPAKITNNIGSICSNTRDKVEEVVGDQESKIRQRIEDLKTEGQKIAALETEGQETVDLKTLAHKITDLKISAYKIAGLENTDQETADLETLAYKIANLKKVADSKGKDQRIKEIECLERLSHKIENLKTEGQKTEGLEILAHKIADLKTKSQKTEDLEVLAHKIADLKMLVHEIADLEALACKIADHNIAAQNLKVCILQIGKNTIGFECTEEKRNYIDLADDSDIVLTFYTSQRELEVRLYPDKQNKNLIRVEVEDQEMWEELKDCNEEIGKNCSLGGYSVHDAIEQGHFKRSGKLCQSSEIVSSSAKTVNKKQQLLQNLRNIESNIVKKEKNFDIKTHLVEIFKTLSRFCEEKGDISKTDLAKAAEKESKKLGLEGKYNWSKIFGLEKGVIEKAEKQGDKEQKSNIPDNFYVKQAIADGNCFFYSFRQGLEQQLGIRATVEQLRQYCKEFVQKNPPEWFINAIANSHDNNGAVRRETPDFYTKNILNNNRWGDPEVEGRILCGKYGVKLHVVEGNPLHATDEQQDPSLHQLIDSSGSRNAGEYNRIDYNDNNVIHIVNKGHDHFEPLLNRNKILAKCYSSSPRCSMDELKIESHRHKVLLVSGS